MNELKQANGLENQIILYAKGWYKQSDNLIEDVKCLITKFCDISPEYIKDRDAQANIIGAFCNYVKPYDLSDALMRGLGVFRMFPNQEPNIYDHMIGKLSVIKGEFVDMDAKINFNLLEQKFIAYSETEEGYWHNKQGWVEELDPEDLNMVFSYEERLSLNLPIDGKWKLYEPTEVTA